MKLLIWLALTTTSSGAATYVGNASCRPCHTRIYESYSATPMARSSGRVIATFPGRFRHAASGVEYRIDARGAVRFEDSEKQLDWFIGSGAAGRRFVYSQDRFVDPAPITFFLTNGGCGI